MVRGGVTEALYVGATVEDERDSLDRSRSVLLA